MCGRYTLTVSPEELVELFGLDESPAASVELGPRYNVAPTQLAPVVVGVDGGRALVSMRWGLVPSWAADEKVGNRHINARCESVAQKGPFRAAFAGRRCLVPASGFYEWPKGARGANPFHLHAPGGRPLAFAGLWESWRRPDGAALRSFAILTREASPAVARIHDRMPVVLAREDFAAWLSPETAPEALARVWRAPAAPLQLDEVSTWVNSPRNDGPRCLMPPEPTLL
jgi:putative SOS response-associated peptidase YedK